MVPGQQDGLLQGHAQGAAAGPRRGKGKKQVLIRTKNEGEVIRFCLSTDTSNTAHFVFAAHPLTHWRRFHTRSPVSPGAVVAAAQCQIVSENEQTGNTRTLPEW